MLTAAELAEMRAEVARAMPSTAAITRRPSTKNAMGGRDNTLAAVSGLGAVPCHVHPDERSVTEGEQQGAVSGDRRYRIMFAYDTAITVADVATIDGVAYELVSVDNARSWALEVEAIAVRRQ